MAKALPQTITVYVTAEDLKNGDRKNPAQCPEALATSRTLGFPVEITEHEVYVRQPRLGEDASKIPRQRLVGRFTSVMADRMRLAEEPYSYSLRLVDERVGFQVPKK